MGNCRLSCVLVSKQLLFASTNNYPGNPPFTLLRNCLISEGVVVGSRCMFYSADADVLSGIRKKGVAVKLYVNPKLHCKFNEDNDPS